MALDYKIFGNRIQTRRKLKGITQEKMAEDLDFSVGFISQLERGITKPSVDTLDDVAKYLECTISDILEDTERRDTAVKQTHLNSMYELLSNRDQRLFYYMLEVYVKNRKPKR